jgi:hypothetical protein
VVLVYSVNRLFVQARTAGDPGLGSWLPVLSPVRDASRVDLVTLAVTCSESPLCVGSHRSPRKATVHHNPYLPPTFGTARSDRERAQ